MIVAWADGGRTLVEPNRAFEITRLALAEVPHAQLAEIIGVEETLRCLGEQHLPA